jgi:hypothetical protein
MTPPPRVYYFDSIMRARGTCRLRLRNSEGGRLQTSHPRLQIRLRRHASFLCHIKLRTLCYKSNTTNIMARTVAVAMCVALVVVLAAAGAVALPADTKCGLEMPSVCNEAINKGTVPSSPCCSVLRERQECACIYLDLLRRMDKISVGPKIFASCGIPLPYCIV